MASDQELRELLLQPDGDAHHALPVNFIILADRHLQLAEALIKCPRPTLDLFDDALSQAQYAIRDRMARAGDGAVPDLVFKELAHVRVHSFPWTLDPRGADGLRRPAIGALGACHLNQMVTISGTLVRVGAVKMYEFKKVSLPSR
jgi:DNA replicative helicase MCM subunit Mcm2 (Cdc46/Mcm family)